MANGANVDGGLSADDLGRQRREFAQVELGQVLRPELGARGHKACRDGVGRHVELLLGWR